MLHMADFFYRLSDVLVRFGISLPTPERWLRCGAFPSLFAASTRRRCGRRRSSKIGSVARVAALSISENKLNPNRRIKMVKTSNPLPRFTPGISSPLDQTSRNFASRVSIQSAQEQRRSEQLPANITAGNQAPRYGDRPTAPPFTTTTPVPVNPAPGEKAGGSKS